MYHRMRENYESTFTIEQRISLLGQETISMADYVWAWSYIRTHSWTDSYGSRFLLPIVSFTNCEPRVNVDAKRFVVENEDGGFRVFADRKTTRGSEILWNYGSIPNQGFLLHYGFIPKINELDCIEISFLDADYLNFKAKPIPNANFIFGGSKLRCLRPNNKEQLNKLNVFNRILNMNVDEKMKCAEKFVEKVGDLNPFDAFSYICPDKKGNESIFTIILNDIEKQITGFKKTLTRVEKHRENASPDRYHFLDLLIAYYRSSIDLGTKCIDSIVNFRNGLPHDKDNA
eukprot:TRINITY_DN6058_c0_g1_i2.p1 TRINITY_DN6058_c0_g1~~TRINITY_DN6058_c0_g1_i2.p1  ORF type:complete len:287 (-),score=22.03 TRINITY_DN6058_c0_g1_i2:43-903(-)